MRRERAQPTRALRRGLGTILILPLALALGAADPADAGQWTIELEPLMMDAYGHDRHVLTVNDLSLDLAAGALLDERTPVSIETNSGGAYRGRFQYDRGRWGWGIDYLWFSTSQDQLGLTAAGGSGLGAVVFEAAERFYVSTGPEESLFFNVLEDTDLAIWTADLYVRRTLTEDADSGLSLLFGLRVGDFDNDYRAVTGVEGVAGTRYDASSNYGAMYGPVVGLAAETRCGKSTFRAYLSQSVLLGEADLSVRRRDFLGPFGAEPAFVIDDRLALVQDVAVPISELRLRWSYRLTRRLALGLAAEASAWWDVPVPPGVVPGGGPTLDENTIVFFGLGASARMTL